MTAGNVNQSDQQGEREHESLKLKENVEIVTMLISKKVKEGDSEVVGVINAHRLTNEVMSVWMVSKTVQEIVNEKDEVMNRNQNWVVGERIVGVKKKRADFFIRVKTRV